MGKERSVSKQRTRIAALTTTCDCSLFFISYVNLGILVGIAERAKVHLKEEGDQQNCKLYDNDGLLSQYIST